MDNVVNVAVLAIDSWVGSLWLSLLIGQRQHDPQHCDVS